MYISPPIGVRPIYTHQKGWMDWLDQTISLEDAAMYAGLILFTWFIFSVLNSIRKLR